MENYQLCPAEIALKNAKRTKKIDDWQEAVDKALAYKQATQKLGRDKRRKASYLVRHALEGFFNAKDPGFSF